MSKYEDAVVKKILSRAHFGLKKYGVSLEREDLDLTQWLTHGQEEAMDLSNYLEVLQQRPEIENLSLNDVPAFEALQKAQSEVLLIALYLEALIQKEAENAGGAL